ncbi:hypothetical protein C8J56DRAFT_899738 [Mycena floridula]|nr:hypothetical protein C8J56DRAFT_899738 [Mycena floridula]
MRVLGRSLRRVPKLLPGLVCVLPVDPVGKVYIFPVEPRSELANGSRYILEFLPSSDLLLYLISVVQSLTSRRGPMDEIIENPTYLFFASLDRNLGFLQSISWVMALTPQVDPVRIWRGNRTQRDSGVHKAFLRRSVPVIRVVLRGEDHRRPLCLPRDPLQEDVAVLNYGGAVHGKINQSV